jgi:hypothetical protein
MQTVKINVNLTYDYNVNVSVPVEIINNTRYIEMVQARSITLQQVTSDYTGGPVKATLWSQRQPVKSGEKSLFYAALVNEGGGTLNDIYLFKILIPTDVVSGNTIDDIEILSENFKNITTSSGGCSKGAGIYTVADNKDYTIDCTSSDPMNNGAYKKVSFFITPVNVTIKKTSLITGLANYNYTKMSLASIAMANAPWR